jgi:hypothetical protein
MIWVTKTQQDGYEYYDKKKQNYSSADSIYDMVFLICLGNLALP